MDIETMLEREITSFILFLKNHGLNIVNGVGTDGSITEDTSLATSESLAEIIGLFVHRRL